MKQFTLFHPDTVTPELQAQFDQLTTVGNLQLIYLLGGRWVLVPGVAWAGAVVAESKNEGETVEEYKARMEPQIEALFSAGLPNGLSVDLDQLNMIKESDQWLALEVEA